MEKSLFARDPEQPLAGYIARKDWDRAPFNRFTFQNVRQMVPTVEVWRGAGPVAPLETAAVAIGDFAFEHDGKTETVDSWLGSSFTDGFVVLHEGQIVSETYMNGMGPRSLHLSQSVAKSVTGVVAGILVSRGVLKLDALLTDYLPELEATAYKGATLQHVMSMTSGVLFDETYTADDSHMAQIDAACGWKERRKPDWPKTMWELVLSLTELEYPHGHSFRYRSIETDVLAFAMERATGKSLAELVSTELWQKLGVEESACFTVDSAGYALADGGFNATLRDYGRFGLMVANGGFANGQQIVPKGWIDGILPGDASVFSADGRAFLPNGAYSNTFWIEDVNARVLLCLGVFGQMIFCDLDSGFVAVKLSTWPDFLNRNETRRALKAIHAIRAQVIHQG